jgi:hypothetical protein
LYVYFIFCAVRILLLPAVQLSTFRWVSFPAFFLPPFHISFLIGVLFLLVLLCSRVTLSAFIFFACLLLGVFYFSLTSSFFCRGIPDLESSSYFLSFRLSDDYFCCVFFHWRLSLFSSLVNMIALYILIFLGFCLFHVFLTIPCICLSFWLMPFFISHSAFSSCGVSLDIVNL